jgi:primosomal protein N' (replication factor Y) (superfamily II helicase)
VDKKDQNLICKVAIPNTHAKAYDYALPDELPMIGTRVWVPFRQKERMGIVLDYAAPDKDISFKSIIKVLDDQPMFDKIFMQWLSWIAQYYHTPFSEILALAIPKAFKELDTSLNFPQETWIDLQQTHSEKISKKLSSLMEFLSKKPHPVSLSYLKRQKFNQKLIDTALLTGLVSAHQKDQELPQKNQEIVEVALNDEQQKALDSIDFSQFSVYLLQGVTGSGKTEVYIEAIKKVIQTGRQVLLLVPEISLTPGLLQRLESRLSANIAVFHSHLRDKQRQLYWLSAYHEKVQLIVGTRSAIFAPITRLGLVIIDEEHDASFKQQEGVRYSAKDAVMMRAKMQNVPVILGTATPTLETFYHAKQSRYQLLNLYQKALTQTPLNYQLIDLRRQKIHHGLADATLNLIKNHLDKNQQVLVFINRRGYAPLLFCHDCGTAMECPRCDANLTVHRLKYQVACHHCGWSQKPPSRCHQCNSPELIPVGVGTEQLSEFLSTYFPHNPVLRFDRDCIKNKTQLEDGLEKIHNRQADLIVATQMLAKGHHFSHLGMVVVVDGDSGFYQADFRALERLGQMITQVSGRAGRAAIQGDVCIQTHLPQHPLLLTLIQQGYQPFIEQLLKQRQESLLPPFSYLALIRVQARDAQMVIRFIKKLSLDIKKYPIEVLGPSPAPIERKANIHRWQLILKASKRAALHSHLAQIHVYLSQNAPKSLRWFIEVDPHDWSA